MVSPFDERNDPAVVRVPWVVNARDTNMVGRSVVIPPSSVQFTSFATFTGGTGRFENATGNASSTGIVDRSTGTGSGGWDGNIALANSPF